MFKLETLTDYSDEALLAEVRRVASNFKGKRLTQEKFNSLSRVHTTTLRNRFGSWSNALDKAGIDLEIAPRQKILMRQEIIDDIRAYIKEYNAPPTVKDIAERLGIHKTSIARKFGKWSDLLKECGAQPVALGRRYEDEECFENIVKLWTHYGRQPNFRELNVPPSYVGSKAYVRRWGGWRSALGAFIEYINKSPAVSQPKIVDVPEASPSSEDSSKNLSSNTPRSLGLALRYKVLCRDRFRCTICGRSPAKDVGVELHVDHIVPWSKGGQNTEENLRALCFDCNLGKGDKHEIT